MGGLLYVPEFVLVAGALVAGAFVSIGAGAAGAVVSVAGAEVAAGAVAALVSAAAGAMLVSGAAGELESEPLLQPVRTTGSAMVARQKGRMESFIGMEG